MATAQKSIHMNLNLVDIHPSKTNPRQTFEPTALAELAESIKSVGVLQAITVRKDGKGYEIIAGERRWRASKAAGLSSIPATVKEVDDKGALEIQVVENLQRADLHPLEEGEGYKLLIDKHGYQVADLAAKVHKSNSYIFHRLRLCSLSPAVKKAFLEDKVKPAVVELIGRLDDHKKQEEVLERITDDPYDFESLSDVKKLLEEEYLLDLKKAPWNLQDAKLVPAAGACSSCPKHTAAQGDLFGAGKKDFCLDGACWRSKVNAHGKMLLERYRKEGKEVIAGKKAEELLVSADRGQGQMVKLDSSPYWMDGGGSLRSKLKGTELSVTLAIGEDGKPHELVNTAAARAAIGHHAGPEKAAKTPKQKMEREIELTLLKTRNRVCDDTANAIAEAFGKKPLTGANLNLLTRWMLDHASHDTTQGVCQRLKLEPVIEKDEYRGNQKDWRETLRKYFLGLKEEGIKALLVHLMVGKLDFPEYSDPTYFEDSEDTREEIEEYGGFDIHLELEDLFKTGHKETLKKELDLVEKELKVKWASKGVSIDEPKAKKKNAAK